MYTTLILTVTVSNDDVAAVKEALREALEGDLDGIYSTEDRPATPEEIEQYEAEFDLGR
jgi:hypothetical protein